jgi:phage shock protein A
MAELPDVNVVLPKIADEFVAILQKYDALHNEIEELQEKVEECVKTANPKLYNDYVTASNEYKRIGNTLEQVDQQLAARGFGDEEEGK